MQMCTISQYQVWEDVEIDGVKVTPDATSGRRLFQSPTNSPSTFTVVGSMDIEPQLEPGKCARNANYGVRTSILLGAHKPRGTNTITLC